MGRAVELKDEMLAAGLPMTHNIRLALLHTFAGARLAGGSVGGYCSAGLVTVECLRLCRRLLALPCRTALLAATEHAWPHASSALSCRERQHEGRSGVV